MPHREWSLETFTEAALDLECASPEATPDLASVPLTDFFSADFLFFFVLLETTGVKSSMSSSTLSEKPSCSSWCGEDVGSESVTDTTT
jgi:hypothetical protein